MEPHQKQFIQLALKCSALRFGQFTLKSGRISPYFFNAGQFQSGGALAQLGRSYSQSLVNSGLAFDMIFGPAYKGIPLATTTAIALFEEHGRDIPYCFNRKETKDHGEGGILVGAPLEGRVVIVDDVITAGTAVREVLSIIEKTGAKPAAVLIGLDRQERGQANLSAITELEQETGIPVISIIKLQDIMAFLEEDGSNPETLKSIKEYRKTYGV